MKNRNCGYFLLVICGFFSLTLQAQRKSISKVQLQKTYNTQQLEQESIAFTDFFEQQKREMGLTEKDEMRFQYSRTDKAGNEHLKYQQFHEGIPVFGSAYNLHAKVGRVHSTNGFYLPLIELSVQPTLTAEEAVTIAIEEMGAEIFSWESETFKRSDYYSKRPEATLQIVGNKFPLPSENYSLVYVVEVYSIAPLDKRQYFIDAQTGQLLFDLPLLHHHSVPAQGITKYYGEQTITVDSVAPNNFLLRDLERGEGVITVNENFEVWSDADNFWDLTNANQDEVAIDGHYCALRFYDYLLEKFNWNGLGGNGEALRTKIHGGNLVNASWDGTYASFGDGDCHHGPLTTLEVVAHEFTHGITQLSSNLVYRFEPGAINESISDVFAKGLEYAYDPARFNWFIGESFLETQYAESFRSLENPHDRAHPKVYKGEFWLDHGSVHINSSIGNHWFYLLVEGKSSVNENGVAYNVEGIGMEKAMEIVFLTQTSYLTPISGYHDYSEYSTMAADQLFGSNSSEKAAVVEAWKAVGIPYNNSGGFVDLNVSFPEVQVYACGQNFYYPLSVTVTNIGTEEYIPEAGVNLVIDDDYSQPLDEPIMPGESLTFMIEDLLYLGVDDSHSIQAEVDFDDNNGFNNYANLRVENGFVDDHDLAIFRFWVPERNCVQGLDQVEMSVINKSCTPIEAGAKFKLSASNTDNSFSWEEEFTLQSRLLPGRLAIFNLQIDFPDEFQSLEVILDYPPDTYLLNNSVLRSIKGLRVIDESYFTEIDDNAFNDFRSEGNTNWEYDLNGDTYFATSHYVANPLFPLCPDAEGTVDQDLFKNTITTCLDFSDWENPQVGFDLIQYRYTDDLEFPELADFTAVARLSWKDGISDGAVYFSGQAEGEIISHSVPLPTGFKGRLTFDFTNSTGDINGDDPLAYDVNLLDNISMNEIVVATSDPFSTPFELYPNPGEGRYFISQQEPPAAIELLTIHGQAIMNIPVLGKRQSLNLETIPDGYYFLKVSYEDHRILTRPLIKLTR